MIVKPGVRRYPGFNAEELDELRKILRSEGGVRDALEMAMKHTAAQMTRTAALKNELREKVRIRLGENYIDDCFIDMDTGEFYKEADPAPEYRTRKHAGDK